MNKSRRFFLYTFLLLLFVLNALLVSTPATQAQGPLPSNDRARGLIYDGLELSSAETCTGLFKIQLGTYSNSTLGCTHGPDAAPPSVLVSQSVPTVNPAARSGALLCDGDGVSGPRVQVLYAHASNVSDRYSSYLSSFKQWAADTDAIFAKSAAQTGGSRHLRFVQDANCKATVPDVTLSASGDDTFGNMVTELQAQGYNQTNRKYMVFVDAQVYCGLANISNDDQPGLANANNGGPSYARIDAGCWSGVIAAHEIMHTLGGVQLSSPNSDGSWHCNDGYDTMCDSSGHNIKVVCSDSQGDRRFDCSHDDYYNTNPPMKSYLATHWNAADSVFLIAGAALPVSRVDLMLTGRIKDNNFVPSDSFKPGNNIVAHIHVVDESGANLQGATVTFSIRKPNNRIRCSLSAITDSDGNAQGGCEIPTSAPSGTWEATVENVVLKGYGGTTPDSILQHTFSVR